MKKRSIGGLLLALALAVGAWVIPSGPLYANGTQSGDLPEAKRQRWAGIEKMLRDQWDICLEHCGEDKACEDRCEKAFKSRLDKEFQKLLRER